MNRLASKISEFLDETRTNFRDFLSEIFDDFCVFTLLILSFYRFAFVVKFFTFSERNYKFYISAARQKFHRNYAHS